MWIRCCIILHILRVEAVNINNEWHEELQRDWIVAEGGMNRRRQELGLDGESDDETDVQHAHRQALSNGQRFRCKVMNDLFDSPTSRAVHHSGHHKKIPFYI
jgi:hypothetical protein